MHILLTNDDGIEAPGLVALARRMRALGRVTVAAPEREQSGVGHAFTMDRPIARRRLPDDGALVRYAVDGTPVDCIKLAVTHLADDPIDLVIAGINPGANAGVSVFYSGTVAAILEAAMWDLPALAVSFGPGYAPAETLDFDRAADLAAGLIEELIRRHLVGPTPLNINIPDLHDGPPRGWRVARQSLATYRDTFEPHADGYTLNRGDTRRETDPDTDLYLCARGYITVTPLRLDLTDHDQLAALRAAADAREEEA